MQTKIKLKFVFVWQMRRLSYEIHIFILWKWNEKEDDGRETELILRNNYRLTTIM